MNKLIAGLCCLMLAASPLALAQEKGKGDGKAAATKKEPSEKQLAHQQRMKDCSAKASDKKMKGDERKSFMSACLKGGDTDASPKQQAQQSRMKECNKQAGDKKLNGDERKTFMSACLKG